jgi:hypothetical protein
MKYFVILLTFALISGIAFAIPAAVSSHDDYSATSTQKNESYAYGSNKSGSINNTVVSAKNQTNASLKNIMINGTVSAVRSTVRNAEELREVIRQRKAEMDNETRNVSESIRNIYAKQNRVVLAVHAFIDMENLTGGIGRNISQIARDFNNSVNKTLRAEEKIQNSNWFSKMLFGGDRDSATEIENETVQNILRIQHLKDLLQACNCTEEVRSMFQEQIQNMEFEQTRLSEIAKQEISNKGLLGWLWK